MFWRFWPTASSSLCGLLSPKDSSQSSLTSTRSSLSWLTHASRRTSSFQTDKETSNVCFTELVRLSCQKLAASNSFSMKSWTHFTYFRCFQLHFGSLMRTNGSLFVWPCCQWFQSLCPFTTQFQRITEWSRWQNILAMLSFGRLMAHLILLTALNCFLETSSRCLKVLLCHAI